MTGSTYPLTVSLREISDGGACRGVLMRIQRSHPAAAPDDRLSCEDLVDVVGFHHALRGLKLFPDVFKPLVADFAAHVLPVAEAEKVDDDRPRRAFEAACRAPAEEVCAYDYAIEVADLAVAIVTEAAQDEALEEVYRAYGEDPDGPDYAAVFDAPEVASLAGTEGYLAERFWQIERLKEYCRGPVEPWPLPPANGEELR